MNEVKINNYFRFYKWPTKAKRDNKKSILNIISPSVAIQIFSRSLHPYLCLPDVLHSLSQVLLVTLSESFHQAHILISQLLEMLAADVHACSLGRGWMNHLNLRYQRGHAPFAPQYSRALALGQNSLWCNLYFRAHCGTRLSLHVSWTHFSHFFFPWPLIFPHSLTDFSQ